MDFWTFLNWLWSVLDKVWAWFSDAFWIFYTDVTHIWDYLNLAKAQVISFLIGVFNDGIQSVSKAINDTRDFINNTARDIYLSIRSESMARDIAIAVMEAQVDNTIGRRITDLVNATGNMVDSIVNTAIEGLRNEFKANLNNVYSGINRVLWVGDFQDKLTFILSGDTYNRLRNLISTDVTGIQAFLDDPLGYTLTLVYPVFSDFLSFVIGYAMGSTENPLPPIPKWTGKK